MHRGRFHHTLFSPYPVLNILHTFCTATYRFHPGTALPGTPHTRARYQTARMLGCGIFPQSILCMLHRLGLEIDQLCRVGKTRCCSGQEPCTHLAHTATLLQIRSTTWSFVHHKRLTVRHKMRWDLTKEIRRYFGLSALEYRYIRTLP